MEDVKVFLGDFQDEKVGLMKRLEATSYLSLVKFCSVKSSELIFNRVLRI